MSNIITPSFRGSFVHLDKPRAVNEGDEPKFSLVIVLNPEDKAQGRFIKQIDDVIESAAKEKWPTRPKRLKTPLRDYDEVFDEDEDFDGWKVINVGNTRRPGLVVFQGPPGKREKTEFVGTEAETAEVFYSGAWYRVGLRPYAWEHEVGGKGVSLSLQSVIKMKDDEPLAGKSDPLADFGDIEDEFDDAGAGIDDDDDLI